MSDKRKAMSKKSAKTIKQKRSEKRAKAAGESHDVVGDIKKH